MFNSFRQSLIAILGVALCLFTIVEVNFPHLQVLSTQAVFIMLGTVLCFLVYPLSPRWKDVIWLRYIDLVLALLTIVCCSYVVIQSEEVFRSFWFNDKSMGDRAGAETTTDFAIGMIGVFLVLESTRRAIGWIVPALALAFALHSFYCYLSYSHGWPELPRWMLPHTGQSLQAVIATSYSHSGVFGTAAEVMFRYVFLFVVFGSFLEISGATQFIIDFAERVFGRSPGGPAKVAVLGSGLMGSLSGSAVANAVTTGAFTIPMMRNSGFKNHIAGGITAAAATGGALVPPVMGAGAYMMLELVKPSVSFLQIARAAVIPAILYYFSLWMIVHFYSRRLGVEVVQQKKAHRPINAYDGVVFFSALVVLIGLLFVFTPFKAVTGSLVVILLLTILRKKLADGPQLTGSSRLFVFAGFVLFAAAYLGYLALKTKEFSELQGFRKTFELLLDASFVGMVGMIFAGLLHPTWRKSILGVLSKSSKNGISLVAASACVGIIIGIITQTGIASDFSSIIKGVVEDNLLVALLGIMCCSIVLGMGVPSVVCYLLMATLMGSLLEQLGVIPLSAHMFIFYFGMMSMVTPPVALAGYASASIAEAPIMKTSFAAFRFSLVGFSLPFMFVYRPALLLMNEQKWKDWMAAPPETIEQTQLLEAANAAYPAVTNLVIALLAAVLGIIALAGAIAGYMRGPLTPPMRVLALISAALLLIPEIYIGERDIGFWVDLSGGILFVLVVAIDWQSGKRSPPLEAAGEKQFD